MTGDNDQNTISAAQMRAIEGAAISAGAVSGLELMERAGAGVVAAVFAQWPVLASGAHRALVLCGPGNNGGDGFVIARLLAGRGWEVEAVLLGDPARLPPDARSNHDRWAGMGGAVAPWEDGAVDHLLRAGDHDLVVDAVFGTGLTRSPADAFHECSEGMIDRVHMRNLPTVAVDIPSGICADTGADLGADLGHAFCAHLTVSFHALKHGHRRGQGPGACGAIVVADIGL